MVQALQNGVASANALELTPPGETLYVQYGLSISFSLDARRMEETGGQTLPLAPLSPLRARYSPIGIARPSTFPAGFPAKDVHSLLEKAAVYIVHGLPGAFSPELVRSSTRLVNAVGIVHTSVPADKAKFLLTRSAYSKAEEELHEAVAASSGTRARLTPQQKAALELLQAPLNKHKEVVEGILNHTDVTAFTAQIGPFGLCILHLVGADMYLMFRQTVRIPGWFDDLKDAGEDVTTEVQKLSAWVQGGGMKNWPFPIFHKRGDRTVFFDGKMLPLDAAYARLSGFTLEQLAKKSQEVESLLRQLPCIVGSDDMQMTKKTLCERVMGMLATDPCIVALEEKIKSCVQGSGTPREIRTLLAKKKAAEKKNANLVSRILMQINELNSDTEMSKRAFQQKMGAKAVMQKINTAARVKEAGALDLMGVLDFMDKYCYSVLVLQLAPKFLEKALTAVASGTLLPDSKLLLDEADVSLAYSGQCVDGLTWVALCDGAKGDGGHMLAQGDPSKFKGLVAPSAPSDGFVPSFLSFDEDETGNVPVQQSSLVGLPVLGVLAKKWTLLDDWHGIANDETVQLARILVRQPFTNLREPSIKANSNSLSWFLLVVYLRSLEAYCKLSPARPGQRTLSAAQVKALGSAAELGEESETKQELLATVPGWFFGQRMENIRGGFFFLLAFAASGERPLSPAYELFQHRAFTFTTPDRAQFSVYKFFLTLAGHTGCDVTPVRNNTRRFVVSETYKCFQHLWADLNHNWAKIEARQRVQAEDDKNDQLRALQCVLPAVMELGGLSLDEEKLKAVAGRAISFFPKEFLDRFASPGCRKGRGAGIIARFFYDLVKTGTLDWERYRQVMQHALNIITKRSSFLLRHRREVLEALKTKDAREIRLAAARFDKECFRRKAAISSDPGSEPLAKLVLAEERVRLLEAKADSSRLAELDTALVANPATASGSCDFVPYDPEQGLRLIVRGNLANEDDLQDRIDQQGIPWSVDKSFQALEARRRRFLKEGKAAAAKDCKKEIEQLLAQAREEEKAAEQNTEYILTGVFPSAPLTESKEQQPVAGEQGLLGELAALAPWSASAVRFIRNTESMGDFATLWELAQTQLDAGDFLHMLGTVGIPQEEALGFVRAVVVSHISHWRDRNLALAAAMQLFADYASGSV